MLALWDSLFGKPKRHVKILCVGLDGSGKSTFTYWLKHGAPISERPPTVGHLVETIEAERTVVSLFDMAGNKGSHHLWRKQRVGAAGLVFVVDLTDRVRGAPAARSFGRRAAPADPAAPRPRPIARGGARAAAPAGRGAG